MPVLQMLPSRVGFRQEIADSIFKCIAAPCYSGHWNLPRNDRLAPVNRQKNDNSVQDALSVFLEL